MEEEPAKTAHITTDHDDQTGKVNTKIRPVDEPRRQHILKPKVTELGSGASILMMGQLYGKLMTFAINQVLMSYLTSNSIGLAALIEFSIGTILYASREGIRLSSLKLNQHKDENLGHKKNYMDLHMVQNIINLSWVSILTGIPATSIIIYLQFFYNKNVSLNFQSLQYWHISLIAIVSAVFVELCNEPYYNLNQYELNFAKRTKIESISSLIKYLVQIIIVLVFKKNLNDGILVLSYCVSQLFYSISLYSCYKVSYLYPNSIILTKIKSSNEETYYYFNREAINYWKSIFTQLIFKHFLTEGDKLLINLLFSMDTQGIFAIINNYGSLFARLLFLPIEESTRMYISKIFNEKENKKVLRKQLMQSIIPIFKFYFYFSLTIIMFAPTNTKVIFSKILTKLIASSTAAQAQELFLAFKAYWMYLPFLAVNGVSEAIFYSITKDPKEINNYSKFMIFCSLMFTVSCYLLVKVFNLGILSLVVSNVITMSFRIIYCQSKLIREYNIFQIDLRYVYFSLISLLVYLFQLVVIGPESQTVFDFCKSAAIGGGFMCVILFFESKDVIDVAKRFKIGETVLQKLKLVKND